MRTDRDSFRGIHRTGTTEAFEVYLHGSGHVEDLGWYHRRVTPGEVPSPELGDGPYPTAEGAYLAATGG